MPWNKWLSSKDTTDNHTSQPIKYDEQKNMTDTQDYTNPSEPQQFVISSDQQNDPSSITVVTEFHTDDETYPLIYTSHTTTNDDIDQDNNIITLINKISRELPVYISSQVSRLVESLPPAPTLPSLEFLQSEEYSTDLSNPTTFFSLVGGGFLLSLCLGMSLYYKHQHSIQEGLMKNTRFLCYYYFHSERYVIISNLSRMDQIKPYLDIPTLTSLHFYFARHLEVSNMGTMSYFTFLRALEPLCEPAVSLPHPSSTPGSLPSTPLTKQTSLPSTPSTQQSSSHGYPSHHGAHGDDHYQYHYPSVFPNRLINRSYAHRLFVLFDEQHDQHIDFFEFLHTIIFLFTSPLKEMFSRAYDRYDALGTNRLSLDEVLSILDALNPYGNNYDLVEWLRISSTIPADAAFITKEQFITVADECKTMWNSEWLSDFAYHFDCEYIPHERRIYGLLR